MEKRRFLGCCAATGLALATELAKGASPAEWGPGDEPKAHHLLIVDAHAHPYQMHGGRSYDRSTPTVEMMNKLGVALSSFSAVGDMTAYSGRFGAPFSDTQDQLKKVFALQEKGQVHVIRKSADLKSLIAAPGVVGALVAIEGGDAIEGRLDKLDAFYDEGVRLMTIMHEHDNALGFNQRSTTDGPLTPLGVQVVERMNKLGMLIDVAHAASSTLKRIAAISATPIIDSHTSVSPTETDRPQSRRLRSWHDLELIAKTGGVVCTWPFAYSGAGTHRSTLKDWAEEIVQMKARLGIEHCGLGTDGGGGLPHLVSGWESIASLPQLINSIREAGLSEEEIAAYVGGNLIRLLTRCLA